MQVEIGSNLGGVHPRGRVWQRDGGRDALPPEDAERQRNNGRVLLVSPAWVGDMVMSQTVVATLARRGAEVHCLAPPATRDLARRMPGVTASHLIRTRHGRLDFGERSRVAMRLRRLRFERAVVLPGSFKSALVPAFARIPHRIGYCKEARGALFTDARALDARKLPRMVDRFAALADADAEPPRLVADTKVRAQRAAELGVALDRTIIALCPGATYGPAKRWPEACFADVARACRDRGADVWLMGGAADAGAAERISRRSLAHNLAGRTSLTDAVDLLSAAHAVVSNDSGLMHVAAALGVPVVAIYGSTTPAFTPPLGERTEIVAEELPCRPCFARECPLGHLNCLRHIRPGRVLAALERLGAFDGDGSANPRAAAAPGAVREPLAAASR